MSAFGICSLSAVPLRKEASHRSELVTQLLFGDLYEVESTQGEWLTVRNAQDGYRGFLAGNQHTPCSNVFAQQWLDEENPARASLRHNWATNSRLQQFLVPAGSRLPMLNGDSFLLNDESFSFTGELGSGDTRWLGAYAKQWLNVPYLWGGKTHAGVDCSGFMQVVFSLCGINLPRDASQQVHTGVAINWDERNAHDLAFFQSQEGKVTHVGLLLSTSEIIHASGRVRIDKITKHGIETSEGRQTHALQCLKRIT